MNYFKEFCDPEFHNLCSTCPTATKMIKIGLVALEKFEKFKNFQCECTTDEEQW